MQELAIHPFFDSPCTIKNVYEITQIGSVIRKGLKSIRIYELQEIVKSLLEIHFSEKLC